MSPGSACSCERPYGLQHPKCLLSEHLQNKVADPCCKEIKKIYNVDCEESEKLEEEFKKYW